MAEIKKEILEKLVNIHERIQKVHDENQKKVQEIEVNYNEQLKSHFVKRDDLISKAKGLENLWSSVIIKAFIASLDTLDQKIFEHLTNFECKLEYNSKDQVSTKTLIFTFNENPIFSNKSLEKIITTKADGSLETKSTPIKMIEKKSAPNTKGGASKKRKEIEENSFFLQFIENTDAEEIVENVEDFITIYKDPFSILNDDEDDELPFDSDDEDIDEDGEDDDEEEEDN